MSLASLIGFGSIAGLAEEVTYGTPVSSDHWLPIVRHSLMETPNIIPVPYLGVVNAQAYHNPRGNVEVARNVGGDLETWLHYDSKAHILLVKHALGAIATTGSGPHVHTASGDTDGVVGLTIQTLHGSGISNPAEVFAGCRVNQLVLSGDAGGPVSMVASIIGQSSAGPAALSGTPSFTAAEEVLCHQGSTFAWNSRTEHMRSFRLTINNNLVRRPRIGSKTTDRPVPGGFASIMLEMTLSWENNNLYTDMRAGDTDDAELDFTGGGNNALAIQLGTVRILDVGRPVNNAGELTNTVRAQVFDTSNPVTVAFTNDNTAAT